MRRQMSTLFAVLLLLMSTTVVYTQVKTDKIEIRGDVSQVTGIGNFAVNSWNYTNFAVFWYDIMKK
jgi:hypothetical protein